MAASSAVALRCCNSNFRPRRAAHAAQLRPEADADLAALDPRRLGLLRCEKPDQTRRPARHPYTVAGRSRALQHGRGKRTLLTLVRATSRAIDFAV
jgi:hypothetical protein